MNKSLKSRVKREMYKWKIELPNGKITPFTEDMIPEGAVGFVYIMNYLADDGQMYSYIGKKNFFSKRKKKFGKKKLAAMTDSRKVFPDPVPPMNRLIFCGLSRM